MSMSNACTWIGCTSDHATEALTDNGRAWAHLCPKHKQSYDARMSVMTASGGMAYSPERLREITLDACGGAEAWYRYVFGPFGSKKEKPKTLIGTTDTDEAAATP